MKITHPRRSRHGLFMTVFSGRRGVRSRRCAAASAVETAATGWVPARRFLIPLTRHLEAYHRWELCRRAAEPGWRGKSISLLVCLSLCTGTLSCSRHDGSTGPPGPDTLCACADNDTLYYPSFEGLIECFDRDASWSPDGSLIAYTEGDHGPMQIWTVEPDGCNPLFLVDGSIPDWSPDGTRIAFMRGFNIYVLTLADSSVQRLTDDGGSAFPDWSPSGNQIAYDTTRGRTGIWIVNADSSDKRWVCEGWSPDWSPDGTRLAFVGPGTGEAVNDIWIVDVAGGNARCLTKGAWYGNGDPSWSPDGERVAWTAYSFGSGGSGIWVMRPDGTGACRMISGGASEPDWSPDGSAIVHTRRLGGSRPYAYTWTLWVFELEGCSKTQITFPPVGPR